MRLLTLNIRHGGGSRHRELATFIAESAADVVVFTEYRSNKVGLALRTAMREQGLVFQEANCNDSKVNSVCIASRRPFNLLNVPAEFEDDLHRVLAVDIDGIRIAGVYFPQNEAKRPVFRRLQRYLLPMLGRHGVILGDLNTGRPFEDEAGKTFYCADCFDDLLSAGLVDSWRVRNPDVKEFSWYSRAGNGFRIDHALSTPDFNSTIRSIVYLHESRLSGTTDHSALLVQCDD